MFGFWNYAPVETVLNVAMEFMICTINGYYNKFWIMKSQNKSSEKYSFLKKWLFVTKFRLDLYGCAMVRSANITLSSLYQIIMRNVQPKPIRVVIDEGVAAVRENHIRNLDRNPADVQVGVSCLQRIPCTAAWTTAPQPLAHYWWLFFNDPKMWNLNGDMFWVYARCWAPPVTWHLVGPALCGTHGSRRHAAV